MSNPNEMPLHPVQEPATEPLRVAVVIDYQNMLTTAHYNFNSNLPRTASYESLLDPAALADVVVAARERTRAERFGEAYRPGPPMEVVDIVVARGMPDPLHAPELHGYAVAHAEAWTRDPRVRMETTPMTYRPCTGTNGDTYMRGSESGVDTTAALETLLLAAREDIDVVIVATHDHDIDPGIRYARRLDMADVETAGWTYICNATRSTDLRDDRGRCVWRTFLDAGDFENSRDRTDYKAQLRQNAAETA